VCFIEKETVEEKRFSIIPDVRTYDVEAPRGATVRNAIQLRRPIMAPPTQGDQLSLLNQSIRFTSFYNPSRFHGAW